MNLRKTPLTFAAAAALTLVSTQALASDWSADRGNKASRRAYAGLELGITDYTLNLGIVESSLTVVSPLLSGGFALGDVRFGLEWGFASGSVSVEGNQVTDDDSAFEIGNPFVSAMYPVVRGGPVELEVGAGIALPLASAEGSDTGGAALVTSAALRGAQDLWLWADNTMSLVVPARAALDAGPLEVGADAALGFMIYTGDREGEETDTLLQLGADAKFGIGLLDLGARVAGVWMLSGDDLNGGDFQMSIEPFAQAALGPVAVRAGFIYNLDEPLGPSFDDNRFWGFRLGAAVGF
ncbi:hypothetical protein L6R52_25425 [Myxococcota bacterium]|nr:hypothetical protein [Myxococcota bacterium]